MMTIRCHLAPSEIEGLGVFATDAIAAGQLIWRLDRRFDLILDVSELEQTLEPLRSYLERYTWRRRVQPNELVLDVDEGRFMNHSDRPNTDFSTSEAGFAVRYIEAGEEITCDYRELEYEFLDFLPSRHAAGRKHGM